MLLITIIISELRVTVLRQTENGKSERLLDFSLLALELDVTQRSFDLSVVLRLGGICMEQTVMGADHRIISTPMADGRADYLFTTKLVKVDHYFAFLCKIKARLVFIFWHIWLFL